MNPAIGDMVHFRSVCAACNDRGRRHFAFAIDDVELLPLLPNFSARLHMYGAGGRKIDLWWDHSPSIIYMYKVKIKAFLGDLRTLFGFREKRVNEDTYLILYGGDDHVFFVGPAEDIVPLADYETLNPTIALLASRMNISRFNYVDLTRHHSEGE